MKAAVRPSLTSVFFLLWAFASAAALLLMPGFGQAAGFGLGVAVPGGIALLVLRNDREKAINTAVAVTAVAAGVTFFGALYT
jgi:predicted branched-subunit amino acid permease